MEAEKNTQNNKEWITKVRLAQYKRLSMDPEEYDAKIWLDKFKQTLLEDGYTEEQLNKEVLEYSALSEEQRIKQMEEKAEALVAQVMMHLENKEEISSAEYPELYHRIQEILALNPNIANQIIQDAFAAQKINEGMSCGDALTGGTCSYYFSKTLIYK